MSHKLLKLPVSRYPVFNRAAVLNSRIPNGFRLEANSESADLYIYEQIGADWWGGGVTASGIADELKKLKDSVKTINVRLNSPGGDVFDGVAIYNQLVQHKAAVNVFVDGLAASAASVIAMAGDKIAVAENGMVMIHNPWSIVLGESADMRKMADTLDKIKETLVTTYAARTKQAVGDISDWMNDELWMTGQEAVDKGFADEVMTAKTVDNSLTMKFAAQYKKAPAALLKPKDAEPVNDFDQVTYLRNRLRLLKSR